MKKLLALLLLCSCSHVPGRKMSVQWPDESQKAKLWTCFEDTDNEGVLLCVDWADFLKYMAAERQKAYDEEQEKIERMRNEPNANSL